MNITPINAVSFKGKSQINRKTREVGYWELRSSTDTRATKVPFHEYFKRVWVFHPSKRASKKRIRTELQRKSTEFAGNKRIITEYLGRDYNGQMIDGVYRNMIRLGSRIITMRAARMRLAK